MIFVNTFSQQEKPISEIVRSKLDDPDYTKDLMVLLFKTLDDRNMFTTEELEDLAGPFWTIK